MKQLTSLLLILLSTSFLAAQGLIDLKDPQIPALVLQAEAQIEADQALAQPMLPHEHVATHPIRNANRADSLARQIGRASWYEVDNVFQAQDSVAFAYYKDYQYDNYVGYSWDGALWSINYRYAYTYTADDLQESRAYQTFDGLNWVDENRSIYTYDAAGLISTFTYQRFEMGAWASDYRILYTYDAQENLMAYTVEDFVAGSFEGDYRYIYTYNAEGQQISSTYQDWDGAAYQNSSRSIYTFDAAGNRIGFLRQTWNGANWEDNYRYVYGFDAAGNQISFLFQNWDGVVWEDSYRNVYTYNANNQQTSYLYQTWDGAIWVNQSRSLYTYDANGNFQSVEGQQYDLGNWIGDYRYIYTYSATNYILTFLLQDWDTGNSSWMDISRSIYNYNADDTYNNIISQQLTSGVWETSNQSFYYYESFVGINAPALANYSVGPNPSTGTLTARFEASAASGVLLEVFDLQGRLVGSQQAAPAVAELSWTAPATLTNGIYTYRLVQGDKASTGKVLLQR